MRITKRIVCFSTLFASFAGSQAVFGQTKDGAILGGVAGAVIGGIVGHQNDETPEGALIGGAVGAIAGGMIGNQREQQQRLRYYEQQPRYYYAPQPHYHVYSPPVRQVPVYTTTPTYVTSVPVQVRRPVSIADVIALARRGLNDTLIINHIRNNGIAHQPTTDDVLALHDGGVSDVVINEMMHAPTTSELVSATTPTTTTTVVREETIISPIDRTRTIPAPTYQRSTQLQPIPMSRRKF